ncbi:BAF_collapsed_G0000330.mRNA.1.CDS.1 [Saccharomyces cerevisiae]|nr:Fun12p [Saccharomyces cerevisiae YJM195]AJO93087.1 Fun12p [Saccharomyces cerevisiae YJM451]AJO93599.1 Fun12p [Saccharomyces cerevisiae YJM627]AJO93744.1 Fun12p [Saccharomyces cerevisiae YJM682]AJO93800.1 Fun12p [Saccharomyces cerevisiae YJM683]AJO95333.1 Fun12p [Saccharomyces cerevisiae YJM1248]AJO96192.1 Fun12p [Saccharomyces cerevisiae YJM1342]AJO97631.1 Fun12p [Saccharomyces cerevisiae YJM1439]CAD6466793.1 Y55_G0048910.mRNA.1.CDS.1 [Saccharomyces cerevisiae]
MAKKSKKNQQNYWDEEFEEDAAQGEEISATPTPNPESSAGADDTSREASASAEGAEAIEGDFMSTLKQSKKKQEKKVIEEKKDGKPILKSKKEKEKEKKEKEKQKKKEQAARKKAQQQAQKEKNKELNKQNVEKAAAEKAAAEKSQKSKGESDKPSASAKKPAKKVPAGLAALRRQLELKKQLEEQEKLEREEEERLEKEEEERLANEEKMKEEARAAKKEKEKAKREKLKAEGKLLTRKQKEEKKLLERRRAALLSSGNVKVAGLAKKDGEENKPKKVVYSKKKKRTTQENASEAIKSDSKKDSEVVPDDELKESEDVLIDDWENLALGDDDEEETNEETQESTASHENEDQNQGEEEEGEEEEEEERAHVQEVAKSTPAATPAATPTPSSASPNKKDLRSPICCILGHVDTGKTKLLDKIRQTNVQGGEAGGITQQIGATYFPIDAIKAKTKVMAEYEKQTFDVPGLLVIDTPGHESFSNLRSRGSSLCNIAILVIDIMHGLEQQTIESIKLLRDRKAPFVVALNKIDRLYDWKAIPNNSFRDSFAKQSRAVQEEFQSRYSKIQLELAEQGLNSELYFQNKNMSKYVSIVPTSAVTGEGVPDLLWLLLELTQKRMSKQLMYLSHVEATILEVKVVEGFGTTIDVILSNGYLREGDRIVLCGMNGPIVTNIRALLTPQPLRELRLKSEYVHHKEVKAALGVKIAANDLEKAVSGSRLLVVGPEDDEDELMDDVMDDLTGLLDSVDTTGKGVVVQASTLGSLEALLDFLKDMKIPVMSIGLGPVYKRDVMKASTMLEKAPEYAVMLCFDVKVDKEAEQYAEQEGIKIFNADVIYHLFDSFTAYQEKLLEERRKDFLDYAIFPCVLQTLQIINKRGPMIIGVDVLEGTLRVGTPICAVKTDPTTKERQTLILGKVISLEINHQPVQEVKKGQTAAGVAVRLEDPSGQQPIWGRHVDENDTLYSLVSRRSIDTLKDKAFRDQVARSDWLLLKKLKVVFGIE